MSRHYSTRDFFRQIPNALLARYFRARGLFGDLDFSAMKETQPDELFAAWLCLPDGQRNKMDAEFRDIFELSCEKGFRAIIDEAQWHLTTDPDARTGFVENLAALSNHCERAMVTFTDRRLSSSATSAMTSIACPFPPDRLMQWRCDADAVCGFVAASLGLRRSDQHPTDAGLLSIGMCPVTSAARCFA